ncbi:ATP-binding cassette domain-containing protein, partial [bacterium]|nr:ATP-binding cassette domain-containing protein [bacterium]
LKIDKGEFVTLLGPSGCGKTTMLKIIGGFTYPTKGKILYNGIDIKDMDITKRPTSTVFQDYALFPNMTVKQNIEYGLKLMRAPIENIDKNFSVQAEKIFLNSQKIAQKKIIEIEKKRQSIKKDIDKVKNKYNKNPFLESITEMRRPEFLATLDSLYEKLEEKYGEDYVSKIS